MYLLNFCLPLLIEIACETPAPDYSVSIFRFSLLDNLKILCGFVL